jgi:hypothetical protein
LGAAEGKFGLLLVALVALMGTAPLIPSPRNEAVLSLFTGAVLVASLHAARPGGISGQLRDLTDRLRLE